MNDFSLLEKTIVRELSCRLCLCTDVSKLKPLSAEIKRKLKRLFDIVIRSDDTLPKAICHDCLLQVGTLNLFSVKVEKTQKFLQFHKSKTREDKFENIEIKTHPIVAALSSQNIASSESKKSTGSTKTPSTKSSLTPQLLGDLRTSKANKPATMKKKTASDMKFQESMSLDEFAKTEKVDKSLLNSSPSKLLIKPVEKVEPVFVDNSNKADIEDYPADALDTVVLVDGRPAKQGAELDKQITLFYKMECCICHEKGFHFRSLMKHYKERHGVPGYVTCCDKKFHYFFPKKIIEHMAYHLQADIFMCQSCHQNFQTSQELTEHQANGGRSDGKILCPRCSEKYPTYHELGWHIVSHRTEKSQCDYCGKLLKHHHRKKTINHMEDVILCSQCIRTLKNIEKQDREAKEKTKAKTPDIVTLQKHLKFRQAMGLSPDEDASTE